MEWGGNGGGLSFRLVDKLLGKSWLGIRLASAVENPCSNFSRRGVYFWFGKKKLGRKLEGGRRSVIGKRGGGGGMKRKKGRESLVIYYKYS